MKFNSIEQAIADIKLGKVVIVVDDESRENEGDFVAAAEMATSEMVNFMATHGRGLICVPLVEDRCEQLGLDLMIGKNTAAYETPFTVVLPLFVKTLIFLRIIYSIKLMLILLECISTF